MTKLKRTDNAFRVYMSEFEKFMRRFYCRIVFAQIEGRRWSFYVHSEFILCFKNWKIYPKTFTHD